MTILITDHPIELIKHSAAIHISNTLTLIQHKIANILLKNAFPSLLQDKRHVISINDIYQQMGWKESNNYGEIKGALKSLNMTQVEWNIIGKDSKNTWGVTTILADVRIKEGTCTYEYSTSMQEMLSKPNIYARLNLLVQRKFKSKYSLVIWEFLVEALCSSQQDKIMTDYISLEIFRKLLGVNDNKCYQEFRRINEKIISIALKEINAESDITVSLLLKKQVKKVIEIAFIAERKQSFANLTDLTLDSELPLFDYTSSKENLKTLLNEQFKMSLDACDSVLTKYQEDDIIRSLEYVKTQISKSTIDNLPAYTMKAIKEKWYENHFEEKEDLIEEIIVQDVLWQEIRKLIKEKIGERAFLSWFNDVEFELKDKIIYFKTTTPFKQAWLQNNYHKLLNDICKEYDASIKQIEIF